MKNKVEDLRNHLFETLEALKDKDNPMEISRAKAVAEVAQVIVDSARVEVELVKATGARAASGFLPQEQQPEKPGTPAHPRLVRGNSQP